MSLSDIKKLPEVYDLPTEKLDDFLERTNQDDSLLGYKRYSDSLATGADNTFRSSSKSSKKLRIVEYWGEYDLEGNGINEHIVFAWIKGSDIVIRKDKNPYPDKEIPFIGEVFDIDPFSVWGNALADSISDNQKVRTAIMRGFMDNMSLSNNGQKFFQKGSIDYLNMSKLLRGEKVIEVNNIEGMKDGSFNQIPSSSFDIFNMQSSEVEELTGVSKHLDGIDNATIGRTAAGVNTAMSSAQRHLVILVAVISELYRKMFKKWMSYNSVFLDEGQSISISGRMYEVVKKNIHAVDSNVEIKINVDSLNQEKIHQINMLLQQAEQFRGMVPPQVIPALIAEIFSGFGKEETAMAIRAYEPEPDPYQVAMQQLEMEMKKAEIELKYAEAQAMLSRGENYQAQSVGHGVRADKTRMDTINTAADIMQKSQAQQQGQSDDYVPLLEAQKRIAEIDAIYHGMKEESLNNAFSRDMDVRKNALNSQVALTKAMKGK